MPTDIELKELCEKCRWEKATLDVDFGDGVEGYKIIGDNGNYIFMPAADHISGGTLGYVNHGYYWSSSLYISNNTYAWCLNFDPDWPNVSVDSHERCCGLSVRPVCP